MEGTATADVPIACVTKAYVSYFGSLKLLWLYITVLLHCHIPKYGDMVFHEENMCVTPPCVDRRGHSDSYEAISTACQLHCSVLLCCIL